MRVQNLYINSQIINSQWSNSRVINTSQLNCCLSFQMCMTPSKSLTPCVLLVEQEQYVLYINLNYTNLRYQIYTTIHKNHMQKILNAIIGENQSVATKNRTILHTFSTIREVIDVPYNSNLALISFVTFLQSRLGFMSLVNLLYHKFVLWKFVLPF